jgi:SAM-dependent methyltransferase
MAETNRESHWETVYTTKGENEVSWFQDDPAPSLALIDLARPMPESHIVDIGGGASRLVDRLLARGFHHVTVLDISASALDIAKARLGKRAGEAEWIVADVTTWQVAQRFDIWHDRAAFHFLVAPADRAAYIARMKQALVSGGHAIIATFAVDGPEKCSGLAVNRYDPAGLARELGEGFVLIESRLHDHATPWNSNQRFQFSLFRRQGG